MPQDRHVLLFYNCCRICFLLSLDMSVDRKSIGIHQIYQQYIVIANRLLHHMPSACVIQSCTFVSIDRFRSSFKSKMKSYCPGADKINWFSTIRDWTSTILGYVDPVTSRLFCEITKQRSNTPFHWNPRVWQSNESHFTAAHDFTGYIFKSTICPIFFHLKNFFFLKISFLKMHFNNLFEIMNLWKILFRNWIVNLLWI